MRLPEDSETLTLGGNQCDFKNESQGEFDGVSPMGGQYKCHET